MIKRIQTVLKVFICCLTVYLLYSMYQTDADRIIGELKSQVFSTSQSSGQQETLAVETERQEILPARYDSREAGRGANVRNQGNLGTCWAVATTSALEAALLPGEHLVFSADHLSLQNGYAKSQNDGGAYTMAMAYLTSWKGPVLSEEDPYGDGYSPEGLLPSKHIQEIQILKNSSPEDIKQAVKDYGSVQTSLFMDMQETHSSVYFNAVNASYCYPKKVAPNHDILIIGWDDDYPAEAFNYAVGQKGAFLCQNSWGTEFGENGVFYVSYQDPNIAEYCTAYAKVESADNYDTIYQTDELGWVGQIGYGEESCYFANVYECNRDEQLEAVGFYAVGDHTEYEIYVVEEFLSPLSLVSFAPKETGSFRHGGFYTVPFREAVPLKAGQKFAVIVKVTTPGETYPVATEYKADEYTETVDLSDGEGYISLKGYQWTRTENEYDCNICLKAYTSYFDS